MFIERAQHLSLLEPNIETNILRDFSLPVRKILVQQVVTFLLTGDNAVQTLISPAHVVWALETCGQGFALPMEEEDSIVKVINLYRRWTLDGKGKRPTPIEKDQQFFIQRMLQHFSLLFEPRTNGKGEVEKHARLCGQVLDIFANIGRQIGPVLSVETWEIFLKLLIAITDTVLGVDAPVKQEVLQRKLCPQLLKVLFELWLLSGTRNPALWDALRQSVKGWTHHMSLILTWKVTCFALTKRSTAILYGPSEGTDCVIVKIDESVQNIQLEDEYVFYSWHRMLNIIGNPSEVIQHPAIFLAYMNGVEILVNQYLKIGHATKALSTGGKESRFLPPDGNTILHIFGTWLYDAIQYDRSAFDEGTALAMKILCNIMTTKHRTDFLPIYMASFYSCMQTALMKEERVLLAAITSATNLFTLEIKGLRCLVPSFIYAIHKVITKRAKPFDSVMPAEHVRRACLTVLSTLLPLPNHFGSTKFAMPINDPAAKAFDVKQYMEIKAHFSMILSEALSNETYPPNLEILLNLAATWGLEEIENSSEFIKQAISLIVRKTTSSNGWPAEVSLVAIKTLSAMSSMYPKLEKGFDQANVIVGHLCKYVSGLLSAGQPQATEDLIVHSFKCIAEWIMVEQWILDYADTKYMLLHALVLGLTGRPQRQENVPEPQVKAVPETPVKGKKAKKEQKKEAEKKEMEKKEPPPMVLSAKIREAAQTALTTLLNQTGNFPTASGASVVSTLACEEDILEEVIHNNPGATPENVKEYMRYYITTDRSIICAIDRVGEEGTFSCILVRNRYGRYAWDVELQYLPSSFEREEQKLIDAPVHISTSPFSGVVSEKEASELSSVCSFLENADTKSAISVIEQHVSKEGEVLENSRYNLNHDVSVAIPQPADPYAGECKFQCSRMLLSHLGFLAFENRTMLYPLQMTEEFFSYLRMLDQLPERECIKVGVVFIRKGQSEDDFYSNLGGTLDYQEMVTSLGWGVNVGKHNGFLGTLDRNIQSGQVNTAPYWSNHGTEVLFHVATLMPSTMSGSDKRRQVTNVYTMIVWAECMDEFTPQTIWKKVRHNIVLIVVSPMLNGLYHVKLFSKNETSGIGPIVDGCVLSKYVLGHLVRDTAISAHRKENHDQETPQQHREQCLVDIFDRFRMDCNLEAFYTAQFTKLKAGYISPLEVADVTSNAASKYHGGPPSKKAKAAPGTAPAAAALSRNAPSSPAPAPAAAKKDRASGSGFSRITPSRSEGKSGSSSWLTMGSRANTAAPSGRSQAAASLGGQHRRAPNEDEDESSKSKKKKSSKKSSKSKKKHEEDEF